MNKKNNLPIKEILTYQLMYRSIFLLFFIFANISINAQSIQYDSFPMPSQIFQRDDSNKTIVPVNGKIYTEGYTDIALLVKRDTKNYFWQKQKLAYQTVNPQNAPFSFETEIKAELSEYSFYVYLFKDTDSTLVKEENEIICGDIILVYGQSNALANDASEIERFNGDNKFGRTAFGNYTNNEFLWLPTKKWNYWSAGLLGLEIQKQLINKYKIPIAIINGAEGNKSITDLMNRDENFHNNPTTIYGRLLKKSEKLGFAKKVKAIVWRQGESEAINTAYNNDYPQKFDTLRRQLLEDYPSIKKIYTFQNNIYFGNQPNAGNLRDFQRKIKDIYPDCEALATFGTITFDDGLHYKLEGYQQTGEELSRLIARDFYKSTDTSEIHSPNIKKIQLTADKETLILEFDKSQNMVFPQQKIGSSNKVFLDLKNYIYLDGKPGNIASGSGLGNQIILKLKQAQNVQTVTYTPDFYTSEMLQYLPEAIPPITNSRGVRAFTFKDQHVSLIKKVEAITLSGKWEMNKKILLQWNVPKDINYTFIIEKSIYSPLNFSEIAMSNTSPFTDNKIKKGIIYYYRLRIKEAGKNDKFSNIVEIKPIFITEMGNLMTNDDLVVFPNPIQKGDELIVNDIFENPVKTIYLINFNGSIIEQINSDETLFQYSINTKNLKTGIYFIEAILEDNKKIIKKFVVE